MWLRYEVVFELTMSGSFVDDSAVGVGVLRAPDPGSEQVCERESAFS